MIRTSPCLSHTFKNPAKLAQNRSVKILLTNGRKASVFGSTKLYTVSIAYQYLKQKMLYTTMYNLLWFDVNCSLCKADKVE